MRKRITLFFLETLNMLTVVMITDAAVANIHIFKKHNTKQKPKQSIRVLIFLTNCKHHSCVTSFINCPGLDPQSRHFGHDGRHIF